MATKEYTAAQVAEHSTSASAWVIVNGHVLDVTEFLAEHPGGEDVLLEQLGGDATESFNDVGHSQDAKDMIKDYTVGKLKVGEHGGGGAANVSATSAQSDHIIAGDQSMFASSTWTNWLIPTAIAIVVAVLYRVFVPRPAV